MAIDLQEGISLKIEGELGKYQTLPVDALSKIAASLQELVLSIAKHDLPPNESVDLDNFKLELIDFQKGSAVPSFGLTQRVQTVLGNHEEQRKAVSKKFTALLGVADCGNYMELQNHYQGGVQRNEIVERLYEFTRSFKNSPVSVFQKGQQGGECKKYSLKTFKASTKKSLMIDLPKENEEQKEEKAFARVKVTSKNGKTRKRIEELISTEHHSLSYSPEIIMVNGKQYILNFPLRSLLTKEEEYYLINNELIDIIGTGETQDEAEQNFNEEFDYLFLRLNSLEDHQLNKRLLRVKSVLNSFIKEVN